MKGWLDNYGKADNANDSNVSVSEDFVGLGYNTKGRNYSSAWGGQFQDGGQLIPVSPMQQIIGQAPSGVSPTVPYLKTKDPVEFYKGWIQSPEYARRQLLTGYSPSAEDESLAVPSAAASRQTRLESLQNIDPITYSTRQPSEARPGVYGIASSVNINPLDYIDTNRRMVEAHELAHIAGAMESEGTTRPGVMSAKEQEIFKKSMLPMKEPVLSGAQDSQQREASKRALEDFEHSKKPKELKADLDALRFTMYDKGIYDITKGQKFTESDFEKAKQNLGKDRVFKRLENRVGKKNFVNLMNTIAKADEEELPMAMGGMSIPGSVGFTYARTAGSAPSEGKYAKKTMASAQKGKDIEKDATNLAVSNKIAQLQLLESPEYQYQKYLESLPQLRQAPGFGEKALRAADVATDVMQMGNFIPNPIAQAIAKVGNVTGTAIDAYQAAADVYEGDYTSAGFNAASAVLPSVLGANTFRRNSKYLQPGQPLYPLSPQARGSFDRVKYIEPFTKVKGMTDKSLMANRALLGTLGAETAYDADLIGPVKKEYGGEIPSAQNGQEMKFYQNGLDWKPKSMQDGGEEDFIGKATKFVSEKISGPVTEKALELLNMVKPISNPEIYKTVRPVDYPNALKLPVHAYNYIMGNESEPLKTKSGKPHLAEEFWATAMGIPVEKQYLKESQYKPSKSKDPDAKYYTIRDVIDDYQLMNLTKNLKPGEKMEMDGLSPILDTKWYSQNATTDKGVKFDEIDPLQRYTLEKSSDGSYVSIYDKYDFNNPALNKIMNPIEIYDRFYLPKKKDGGIVKDNDGYLNPNNFGKVVEIDSNNITMEGVYEPLLGVSDTGDTKLMKPGKNYKFKGKKVTEFPVMQKGGKQLSQNEKVRADNWEKLYDPLVDLYYDRVLPLMNSKKIHNTKAVDILNKGYQFYVDPYSLGYDKKNRSIPPMTSTLKEMQNKILNLSDNEITNLLKVNSVQSAILNKPKNVSLSDINRYKNHIDSLKKVGYNFKEGGKVSINDLDAQPMKKLNQLLNFTNNPDKDNWLDKYN
jgi:hypothetical protein